MGKGKGKGIPIIQLGFQIPRNWEDASQVAGVRE